MGNERDAASIYRTRHRCSPTAAAPPRDLPDSLSTTSAQATASHDLRWSAAPRSAATRPEHGKSLSDFYRLGAFNNCWAPALISPASPPAWKKLKPARSFHASGPPSFSPALRVAS